MNSATEIFFDAAYELKGADAENVSVDSIRAVLEAARNAGFTAIRIQLGGHLTDDESYRPTFIREIYEADGESSKSKFFDECGAFVGVDVDAAEVVTDLVHTASANRETVAELEAELELQNS